MHAFFKNRYVLLFIAVVLFLLIPPFVSNNWFGGIIISILLSVVTIQSVSILVDKEKNLRYGFVIAFIVLAIIWITHFLETPDVEVGITNFFLFIYFGYILYVLIRHMIKNRGVDLNMILMAITIYLLFAICGGFLFAILNGIYDNAYNISEDVSFSLMDYIYYSFITLTTLGYGDVLPLREETRIPAALLATGGQFYIAVVVAVLVGKYTSSKNDK